MRYSPHEYQRYAAEYIKAHPAAAVFLACGLGKTSITLTAVNDLMFDSFEIHRALVVAPIRVASFSWPAEIEKWDHLEGLKYSVAVGTAAERLAALKKPADIYLINRENVQWLISESGIPFDFDMVVIDELSSFKNHQTKRFKALMKVRPKVKRIVGLTGTPSSNGLMDLWAEFRLLDMGERLGRFIGQYRTSYFRPDKQNGQVVFSYKPLPGAEKQIYGKISDITISMKSTDHLRMPELINSRYTVYLSGKEDSHYADLKKDLVLQLPDGDITAANAASLSGKLSQMANGAVYTDAGETVAIHERKLDALEDIIEAAKDLGANGFTVFRKIIFPLSVPGLLSGIVMVFVPSMTSFVISDILGGGKLQLIGNIIEQEFTKSANWNLGSGLSVSLMIFVLISMAFTTKNEVEGKGSAIW